ncbi:urocanate reductase [Gottschalkiaceae bacterium SANA]|nr:urocanate reductase [Gottschalkiaceae bacterium SANA]
MKRILSVLLILMMIMTLAGCSQGSTVEEAKTVESAIQEGTFTGNGEGKNGDIEVEVTIAGGVITEAKVLSSGDTEGISDAAITQVIAAVVANNSTNVEAVSGASLTSYGLLEAIRDALSKAGATEADFTTDMVIALEKATEEADQTYDVVIVGAGGAGLAAAVEASEAGANVVVIEKMPFIGGNTMVSGGGLNVPGSWAQTAVGVDDSIELYFEDTMKGGDNLANPSLVHILADNALNAAVWLKDDLGVGFMEDRLQQFGGHSVARAIIATGNHGTDLIEKLAARAQENGVTIKTEVKANELLIEDGRVVGIVAEAANGEAITFHAAKGVIMATGGFGSNMEMRMQYNPELDDRYMTTDQPGTTGDGIVMAQAVNAELIGMEYIQTYPMCNPVTGIISYVANTRFDGGILVNVEGERFVNEMDRRDVVSRGILAQTSASAYLLWGQEIETKGHMTEVHAQEFATLKDQGLLVEAATLEEAADAMGVNVEALTATVADYNQFVAGQVELEIAKKGALRPIAEGPFYLQRVVPSVHHTMGGLMINEEAQVINQDGEIVEGLFAAGEVTGGIHGSNRLGGNAVTDVIVFGRIAGRNVVK